MRHLSSASDAAVAGLLLLLTAVACLVMAQVSTFSWSYPPYFWMAEEYLATARIGSDFYPVGYALFLAACWWLGALDGIVVAQCLTHAASVMLAYLWLRVDRAPRWVAYVAGLLVLAHPFLLRTTRSLSDNNLTVPVLLALVIVLTLAWRGSVCWRLTALGGLLLGFGTLVRPNLMSLVPLVVLVYLWPREACEARPARRAAGLALLLGLGLITALGVTFMAKGNLRLVSHCGSYNLLAGANEYSAESLRSHLNAEGSLFRLQAEGRLADELYTGRASRIFSQRAMAFIEEEPVEYARLSVLKLANLFRVDWRHVGTHPTHYPRVALATLELLRALPVVIWLGLRWLLYRRRALVAEPLLPLLVLFFVLPFVLTNSDPRFRLPLDVLFLVESVRLYAAWRQGQRGPQPRWSSSSW